MLKLQKSELKFLSCIIAIGLMMRLFYLYEYSHSPFFDSPIVDANSFLRQALFIAEGNWLGKEEPFWQPPLYIYFLSLICWLSPENYFVTIRLIQIVLGISSIVLLFHIARNYFNTKTAKIATAIYSTCGSVIYFELELLAVPLEIFFNLLLICSILHAEHTNTRISWLCVGLICGISIITRPNIVLFIVTFCLLYISKRRWKQVILIAVPTILCIFPISLRNYAMEADPVIVSSNAGINFFIGNSGNYLKKVSIRPGMSWDELVTKPILEGHKTAAAKSNYFIKKSIDYIQGNKLQYLYSLGEKFWLFWNGTEIKRNTNIYYSRNHSQLLSVTLWEKWISFPFGIIAPLALLGIGAAWHSYDKQRSPLLHVYLITYIISILLFFVTSRYRMPLIPVVICFSALGLQYVFQLLKHGTTKRKITSALIFIGLLTACNWTKAPNIETDAQLYFDLGEIALREKEYSLSETYSRQALQLDPNYNYARHNLAVSLFHQNKFSDALRIAQKSTSENPKRADTQLLLARIYWALNDETLAKKYFQISLNNDPNNGMAHYYYGRFLYKSKNFFDASIHLSKAVNSLPNDAWIHYDVGRAYHQKNDLKKALEYYESSWKISASSIAANAIGAIHLQQGHLQKAQAYFNKSLEKDSTNIETKVNIAILTIQSGSTDVGKKTIQQLLKSYPNSASVTNAARAYDISRISHE